MTFDIDFVKIPYWVWGCFGAGSLWVVKAWADKRYAPFIAPLTDEQKDLEDKMRARKILATKEFIDAVDHQVNSTMMSGFFREKIEGIVTGSSCIHDMVDKRAQKEVSSQFSEKITGMGDTQRMMLDSLKDIKKSLDDLKMSSVELKTRLDEHIKRDE